MSPEKSVSENDSFFRLALHKAPVLKTPCDGGDVQRTPGNDHHGVVGGVAVDLFEKVVVALVQDVFKKSEIFFSLVCLLKGAEDRGWAISVS